MLQIKTYNPCNELKEIVRCYWTLDSNGELHSERVISNTDAQLFFHFKNPFKVISENGETNYQPKSFLCGASTKPKEVITALDSEMFGVVFYPHTARYFLPIPMAEFTNINCELKLISGRFTVLDSHITESESPKDRINVIEKFLLSELSRSADDTKSKTLHNFISYLNKAEKNAKLEQLIKGSGLSERQVQRLFNEFVGIPPKKYFEIKKIESAIKLFKSSLNLTEIAYRSGYYDQSHFINSFKNYTGLLPKEFKKIACN